LASVLFLRPSWVGQPYLISSYTAGYRLVLAGVLGRLCARLYIGGRSRASLQVNGPTAWCHPLYVGSMLVGLGMVALSESPIVLQWDCCISSRILGRPSVTRSHAGGDFRRTARGLRAQRPMLFPAPDGLDATPPESITLWPLHVEFTRSLTSSPLSHFLEFVHLLQANHVLPYITSITCVFAF